ncbi:unnamed protein product [Amoebophrya sp. A120]|nr:unnamed protein product [Amoebophrya sp. A120]|eukprot:GSA120T00007076001.1
MAPRGKNAYSFRRSLLYFAGAVASAPDAIYSLRLQHGGTDSPFGEEPKELKLFANNKQREKLADKLEEQVHAQTSLYNRGFHISSEFVNDEKNDDQEWRKVKSNANLKALLQQRQQDGTSDKKPVTTDDLNKQIQMQRSAKVDIHTPFAVNEKKEKSEWKKVKAQTKVRARGEKMKVSNIPASLLQMKFTSTKKKSEQKNINDKLLRDWDSAFDAGDSATTSSKSTDATTSTTAASVEDTSSSSLTSGEDAMARYMREFHVEEKARQEQQTQSPGAARNAEKTFDFGTSAHASGFSAFEPASSGEDTGATSVISIPLNSQLQISESS